MDTIFLLPPPGALSRHKMARTSWVWENRWIDLTHFRPRLGLGDWWLLEADLRLMGPLATGLKWKMTGSTPLEYTSDWFWLTQTESTSARWVWYPSVRVPVLSFSRSDH